MVYLYGLKNNVIRCYFEIHMLSVVNYHGPGLIEIAEEETLMYIQCPHLLEKI